MVDYESKNGSRAAVEPTETIALRCEHRKTGSCQLTLKCAPAEHAPSQTKEAFITTERFAAAEPRHGEQRSQTLVPLPLPLAANLRGTCAN